MEPILISDESVFSALLKESAIIVVDFFSDECPPCERFAPIFERLARHYGMVQFVKIFRQEHRELASSYSVQSSPTVLFFYHGVLQETRLSSEILETDVQKNIDELLRKEHISVDAQLQEDVIEERDLCIVGMGPAGFTAAVYAARYRVDQVLVGELAGGLMTSSHKICNYPSENEISGMDLTQKMFEHVQQLNVPIRVGSVHSIVKRTQDGRFDVSLSDGTRLRAKSILLATGTKHRHLGVENEDRFAGRGVSYCATCDAAFFQGKTVAVIGGGDSANTASLYLAEIASKVYQIYRGTELKGETAWIEQVVRHPKISVLTETNVTKLFGEQKVQGLEIDRPYHGSVSLELDGVFVEVGSDPDGRLIEQLGIQTNEAGYVQTGSDQTTSVNGVWAAGDLTTGSDGFRQIVTACSEGAIAARSVFYALKKLAQKP